MTPAALCKRLTVAPMVPRKPATGWMAALMVLRAAVASAMLNKAFVDPAVPLARVAAPKVLAVPVSDVAIPLPVSPLVNAVNTTVLAVATAEAEVLAIVGLP